MVLRHQYSPLEEQRAGRLARPVIVWISSVIMIIFGFLCFAHFMVCFHVALSRGGENFCAFFILAILEASCLYLGLETFRGRARDTLVSGISSVVLGLYSLSMYFWVPDRALDSIVLFSMPFFVAGVVALLGRKKYAAWRKALNASPAAKKGM
jgi:hypothetical protein